MTDRTDLPDVLSPPSVRTRRAAGVTGASVVAAGAARASGERARRRRRTTPLLADLEPDDPVLTDPVAEAGEPHPAEAKPAPRRAEPAPVAAPTASRTRPRPTRSPAAGKPAAARTPAAKTPAAKPPPEKPTPAKRAAATSAAATPSARKAPAARRTPGGKRLVAVTDLAAEAGEQIADVLEAGHGTSELQERITAILEFLRRRLTGDYAVDEFGFDPELNDTVFLALLRVLYQRWFRVEVRGIDNVPSTGGALIVANHAGAIALDSVMVQVALHDEHPKHRHLRPLAADLVFQAPVLGEVARKAGATLANTADAERLLAAGEVVGVWPEGFKGIGKPFSERYKLQRFGRGGFVSAALRTRTPIIPCAIVGSEETYPILGNMPAVARLLGLPYMPITPTFPLLGVLGTIPLPSKWLIEFGTPVITEDFGPNAADDPMLVFDLTDQVRQTIQQTLYQLLVQRQSAFF